MHDAELQPRLMRSRSTDLRWAANTGPTVIVVDETPDELVRVQTRLQSVGIVTLPFQRGSSALIEVGRAGPDAALIAADVSDVSCIDWVRAARGASPIPVLVGMRHEHMHSMSAIVMAGASAIVGYPFDEFEVANELQHEWEATRTRNVSRHYLRAGPLELDARSFSVSVDERTLRLSLGTFELLWCLMLRANRVVGADEISRCLGRPKGSGAGDFVKGQIAKLRTELGDRTLIQTVRGQGYTVRHLLKQSPAGLSGA